MSTSNSWEGIRQVYVLRCFVRAMYLSASEVCYLGRYIKCSTFTFTFFTDGEEVTICLAFVLSHAQIRLGSVRR